MGFDGDDSHDDLMSIWSLYNDDKDKTSSIKSTRSYTPEEIKALEDAAIAKHVKASSYTPAIHEVLQKAADSMPNKSKKDKAAEGVTLPHQFTLEEWASAGTGFGTPAATGTESSSCLHDWQLYEGFHFSDYYCTKCNITRPVDPSR